MKNKDMLILMKQNVFYNMKYLKVCLAIACLSFVSCQNKTVHHDGNTSGDDSLRVDAAIVDDSVSEGVINSQTEEENEEDDAEMGGSLNDIRFSDFTAEDWLDNEYIRALRTYLDQYNAGKVENENLEPYKDKIKGKFVIGNTEPFLGGGMFIRIVFLDMPDRFFAAWVYSFVDEDAKKVTGYEVRSVSIQEERTGFIKEEILEIVKEHPELKFW